MWPVTNRLRTIRLQRGAIMSEPSRTVLIQENEPLVGLLRAKREELLASADVLRVKGDVKRADGKQKYVSTIDRAWCSLCDHRTFHHAPGSKEIEKRRQLDSRCPSTILRREKPSSESGVGITTFSYLKKWLGPNSRERHRSEREDQNEVHPRMQEETVAFPGLGDNQTRKICTLVGVVWGPSSGTLW